MRPVKSMIFQLKSENLTKEFQSKKLLKMYLQSNEQLLDEGYQLSIVHKCMPFISIHNGDVYIDEKSLQPLSVVKPKQDTNEVIGTTITFYVAFGDTNDDVKKYVIHLAEDYSWIEFFEEEKPTILVHIATVKPVKPDTELDTFEFFKKVINAFVDLYLL